MRLGFFGGSFNPPTNAHISLAKKALKTCNLDKVIFVPMGDSYKKKDLVPARHRYNMLKIICEEQEDLEVSDLEINIDKEMYAIDAFKIIENKYKLDDIYFIMGDDNFVNITKWKESEILTKNYKYIVLDRESIDVDKYINDNENLKAHINQITIIKNEEYKMHSSTEFRNILKNNKTDDKNKLPCEVLEYIAINNLYKD